MEKRCNTCENLLPVGLFGFSGKRNPTGERLRLPICKKCRSDKDRARNEANREQVRAYHRAYDKQHGHRRRAARRLKFAQDAEFRERENARLCKINSEPQSRQRKNRQARDKRAALPKDQREAIRARDRARYQEQMAKPGERERRLEVARIAGRNKQKDAENSRKWREANPLKFREYGHRRRARIVKATVGKVSYDRILERDGMHCYLCDNVIAEGDLSFDHVIPLVRGGAHSEVKPTHKSCNFRKWTKLPHEIRGTWLNLVG